MSKSLGNVVLPTEICEKWGADLLRLWVASQDYTADVRMSENAMTQLSEAYRKLRNTFRFVLGNLADFDPAADAVPEAELEEMDRWMLSRTAALVRQCRDWYALFEFHRVFHALHDYAVVDLSAFYFDVLKDRLYTFAPRSRARRSAQTAIYRIAGALLRLAAPLVAFTAEEIWKYFPRRTGDPESVHLALFPLPEEVAAAPDPAVDRRWQSLLALREDALKGLEEKRKEKFISGSLEARVRIRSAPGDGMELLRRCRGILPALFIVSQVEIVEDAQAQPPAGKAWMIEVARAEGRKCERCWNYSRRVGESADYPTVCERCVAALEEIEHSADDSPNEPAPASPPGNGAGA
jgi:isoleucyl-tRNA synthetase